MHWHVEMAFLPFAEAMMKHRPTSVTGISSELVVALRLLAEGISQLNFAYRRLPQ